MLFIVARLWFSGGITPRFEHFRWWNRAIVLFQFEMRVLFIGMVRSPATFRAEPFVSSGIPYDVFVFHRARGQSLFRNLSVGTMGGLGFPSVEMLIRQRQHVLDVCIFRVALCLQLRPGSLGV